MKTTIKSPFLALLLFTFCLIQVQGATEDAEEKKDEKIYVVYTNAASEDSGSGVVITQLYKEEFQGITCLSGRGVDGYIKGVPIRIPVKNIVMIMEYKSADDYTRAVLEYERYERK